MLDHIMADLCYTFPQIVTGSESARISRTPSGRKLERPSRERCRMLVYDCRPIEAELTRGQSHGFELRAHRSAFRDDFDESAVGTELTVQRA